MVRNSGAQNPFPFPHRWTAPHFVYRCTHPTFSPSQTMVNTSSLSSELKWDCLVWLRALGRVFTGKDRSA